MGGAAAEVAHEWWGEGPPYPAPVFVLAHYPHIDSIEMESSTTFRFMTSSDGAMKRGIEAADEDTVTIASGANALQQGCEDGVDGRDPDLPLPVFVLGGGEKHLRGPRQPCGLEPVEVRASPNATPRDPPHLRYPDSEP